MLEIASNDYNPLKTTISVDSIVAAYDGGISIQVYDAYLKNKSGLYDNSKYAGAVEIQLFAAIFETRSSRSDAVCFDRTHFGSVISLSDSCIKGQYNNWYCSGNAYLTNESQQIVPSFGSCSEYEYCIDMYERYCIRGGDQLNWQSSYPL